MAAKQEESLGVSTNSMQSRLANINEMAERTEAYAVVLGRAVVSNNLLKEAVSDRQQERLSSNLEVLADRQEVMGEVTYSAYYNWEFFR